MQTILITGFGRFPGSPVNPSGVVAARLAKHRRPALAGTRRVAHVFATRYDAVDRELPALLEREKPDIVMMLGVAPGSRQVRIEERARNRIALLPDAGRHRPAAQTIALNRDAQRSPLPLARLVTAARSAGVAAMRSRNPGSYLCNYVYWRGLEAAARPDGPDTVIFVHVPPVAIKQTPKRPLKEKPRRRPPGKRTKPAQRRRRAPGIDDLVRAGEAIVVAMIPLATQPPVQADSSPAMVPLATQTPVQADSGPAVTLATQSPVEADSGPAVIPLAAQPPVQADSNPAMIPPATQSPVQADSGPAMIPPATQSSVQADSGPAMIPPATRPPVQADSGSSNRLTGEQPSRWSALARRVLAAGKRLQAPWRRD